MALVCRYLPGVFMDSEGHFPATAQSPFGRMHSTSSFQTECSNLHSTLPFRVKLRHKMLGYGTIWGRRKLDGNGAKPSSYTSFWISKFDLQHEQLARVESGVPMDKPTETSSGEQNDGELGDEGLAGTSYFELDNEIKGEDKRRPDGTQDEEAIDEIEVKCGWKEAGKKKCREVGSKNGGSEGTERNVEVEVEVVSWRERHIRASVCVEASYDTMWDVLTDYERLTEFIPSLVRVEKVRTLNPGRLWLLQEGAQRTRYWRIGARVVLDLEELPHAEDGKELRFFMVDGDFKCYNGRWYLRPGPTYGTIMLHYEVNVTPKLLFPASFLERIIREYLPINMHALAKRAETDPSKWDCTVEPYKSFAKQPIPSPLQAFLRRVSSWSPSQVRPARSIMSAMRVPSLMEKDAIFSFQRGFESGSFGSNAEQHTTWNVGDKLCDAKHMCQLEGPCAVDEVHLRRLDDLLGNGGLHRHVVASITVESPVKDVWNVLTEYESLYKFIPNLVSSRIISRENDRVQVVQEGCKCVLYMVLHARVVLDLWEKPESEIIFQQVEGDFDSFQGKWILEPLGSQHTLLKYVVNIKMHRPCLLAEAIIEEVIYEDLPANLCALRARMELRNGNSPRVQAHAEVCTGSRDRKSSAASLPSTSLPEFQVKRFRVAGLQTDFRILQKELFAFIMEHGREGYMPMRSELRQHKRVDLEKAISRMGGFSVVATRLNLCQQRRPRGYWDNFQNLRQEILLFQKESGMDRTYMPTRNSLNKAGRPDVARALEKWGGVQEVARLMGLNVRRARLRSASKTVTTDRSSVVDENNPRKPLKISLPANPTKWVEMPQEMHSRDGP